MNEAPRILVSATLIVRDEATRIEACLESVASMVEEVVVVDTGSVDATVEIARSLGARVFEQPWRSDFSFHRNHALEWARGDWVLVIDGDETLECAQALRKTIEAADADPEVDGVTVWVDAVIGDDVADQAVAVRAFRRGRGRYEYPVHNQLRGMRQVVASPARIRSQYGGTLQSKAARSIPLLETLLTAPETRRHALYFLARTHFALQNFHACKRHCDELLLSPGPEPSFASIWTWAAWSTLAVDGIDAAEAVLAAGLACHPRFADLRHCQVALAAWRWNESVNYVHTYLMTGFSSLRIHERLPELARMLRMPMTFQRLPRFVDFGETQRSER